MFVLSGNEQGRQQPRRFTTVRSFSTSWRTARSRSGFAASKLPERNWLPLPWNGHIRLSTKPGSSLTNLYDELRYQGPDRDSLSLVPTSNAPSERVWKNNYPVRGSVNQTGTRCRRVLAILRPNHILRKNKLTNLTDAEYHSKFFDWRRANYKRKPPTNATIVSEIGKFKVFAEWCQQEEAIL